MISLIFKEYDGLHDTCMHINSGSINGQTYMPYRVSVLLLTSRCKLAPAQCRQAYVNQHLHIYVFFLSCEAI